MESHANHLKVEVKEEAVEEQVRSLTLPSSSQQAARVGSSRVSTEDVFHYDMDKVKEEDVGVKDEPLQDQDDLSVNTTTFCPKPRSRPEGLIDKKNIMKGRLRTVKGPLPLHHGPNTSQLLNVRSIKRESAGSSRYCNASPTPDFKRKPNWTKDEDVFLTEKVSEEKYVLLRNGVASRHMKKKAWEHVAALVNAVSPHTARTGKGCEKRYRSIKLKERRITHAQRKDHSVSGAGPIAPVLTPVEDILGKDSVTIEGLGCTDRNCESSTTLVLEEGLEGPSSITSAPVLPSLSPGNPDTASTQCPPSPPRPSFVEFCQLTEKQQNNIIKYEQLRAYEAMREYYRNKMWDEV